jgi:MFS superfamily sulfate permease-like transporter
VLAAGLSVVTGRLCFVAWAARLGLLADLLSKPILVGYMAGVALIMIAGQLERVTGVPVSGQGFLAELGSFVRGVPLTNVVSLMFSAAVLGFLLVMQWRFPRLPGPLLAVLRATLAVAAFDLQGHGISVVGPVPTGLPRPALPGIGDVTDLLLPAVGILVVGYTDAVLTARSFAARGGREVVANRELLALGASNVGAGLLKGFPVSSSASRTALADASGARTQVYSLVSLVCVLAVLMFLGPLLAMFPTAALGALIIYAAIRLVDVSEFRRLATFRRAELILAIASCAGVLVVGILYGVLLAIGLSVAEMLARVARPHDAIQGFVPGLAGMHDIDDDPQATLLPGLVVYRYDSPLFFANVEDFKRRAIGSVELADTPTEWFLLNAEANVQVDITAIDALEELRQELGRRGIVFAMARVKQDLHDDLLPSGFLDRVGRDRVFMTLPTAVRAYVRWYEDRHGVPPDGAPPAV